MATYAIGDVQGCLGPLEQLLAKIAFDSTRDQLWFTGDLINRGYHSLETLRFIKSLANTVVVLGNHDLALLAVARGSVKAHPKDTFEEILGAADKASLLEWLRHRPLLHHDDKLGFTMTHAGIYPAWDLNTAIKLAKEVGSLLQGPQSNDFLDNLFGNTPLIWKDDLIGWDRARFIINSFTRMRFCTQAGELDLKAKGSPEQHSELIPWYAYEGRKTQNENLIFGHWAALSSQEIKSQKIIALDTGCVWGNCLTAFCLETKQKVSIDCKDYIQKPLSLDAKPR